MFHYKYRQQLLYTYLWPDCHIISNPCNKYDNCIQCDEDKPILFDATEEVYKILEVAKALTFKFSTKISLEDVVNVFSRSNTEKIRKNKYDQLVLCRGVKLYAKKEPTRLISKETAQTALNDLVSKRIIKQKLQLQKLKTI
ncbi:ATP dependent DNA helicase [Gigaspora margarita]|uniref:ATP dependent DNA helicase n=1 Tax=Gigaspora margarita TaxID=4874 RepID=A0A8H4AQ50_GIGMA|nr:ATP dependent DNA helicase [Gigaspora margarita]